MTDLRTNVVLALDAIRSHRLRSFLTTLGLTIGVATLIAVMTLIQGANNYVAEEIANLGTNVFRVAKTPFATTDFREIIEARRNPDIRMEDYRAVRAACSSCQDVGASVQSRVSVRYENRELRDITLFGETANMAGISTRTIERGRFFTSSEDRHAAFVCLIGDNLTQELFPGRDPVGRNIRVGKDQLRVIGTFERIGAVLGQEQDNFLVVPLQTFFRMRGFRHSLTLEIKAAGEGAAFDRAMDEVHVLVRARRGITPREEEDFYIGAAESYISLWETISSSFVIVFTSVSSISAVVGGIVIMNIMLVSVTERTKEIGIRRACGARRSDIVRQFLTESVLQCLAGGVIGVLLGFVAALLIRQFSNFPAQVAWWVALLGVGVSSGVGLFFGIYPALRAADLDPIEALHKD